MEVNPGLSYLNTLLFETPASFAVMRGSPEFPNINGMVRFYPVIDGVLVYSELYNLPVTRPICSNHVFGFHIHQGRICGTDPVNPEDPFGGAGPHYNPGGCQHPAHAGDMPPLFASPEGFAWSVFLSTRFKWGDVLGLSVIVHAMADDFHSQPTGNSGKKIACGIIEQTVTITETEI